ncbi:MAG: flagellar motor protein MotB [Candidatus Lustribacter sp.]|jgi:chemotaxis protein MotB
MDDRPGEPADQDPRAPEHDRPAAVTAADGVADTSVHGEAVAGEVRDTDAEDEAAKHGPKTFVSGTTPSLSHVRAPTIVIRRKRKGGHGGAHGGSWKIAYADFVTAMMAFFLLMWLLSSTSKSDLQGIADYFNRPLQAAFTQGPGASATTAPQTAKENGQQSGQSEDDQLQSLKTKLDTLIDQNPKLKAFKNQIKIDITSEGLRIQILDNQNRPMFDKGDAVLKSYTKDILDQIGPALNDVPNHISIAGHTDALPYHGMLDGYSNWELSSERANAARRELLAGGMKASKVLQIRGLADALPFLKNDPTNPANRRISIVVLNTQAEQQFLRDGQQTPSETPAPDTAAPANP